MKEQTSSSDTRQLADVPVLAYAQRDPSLAAPVTTWVVADAGAEAGANLIAAAYAFAEGTEETVETESSNAAASEESLPKKTVSSDPGTRARVAVLHPPETPSSPRSRARAAGRDVERAPAAAARDVLASGPDAGGPEAGSAPGGERAAEAAAADALLARQGAFASSALGARRVRRVFGRVRTDEQRYAGVLVVNGRVVEVPGDLALDADDFAAGRSARRAPTTSSPPFCRVKTRRRVKTRQH